MIVRSPLPVSIFRWFFFFLLAACSPSPPGEQIVALVGEDPIYKSEVEEFAASLLPGLRSKQSGQQARLDYLQTLIDEKLLVRRARDQGLDTTRSFAAEAARAFRDKVVDYYQQQHLSPRVTVIDEEIRERFIKDGFNRERALSRLVVQTEEEAARLREQWEQGADFAVLAREHSLDQGRASQGGYMGFISRPWALRMHIPAQTFDSLATSVVSQPLPLGKAYQLICFTEERDADPALYRRQIERRIRREKTAIQRRALAEELTYELGLRLRLEGLEILKLKRTGSRLFPELSPQEAATPLYTYKRGAITVGAYIDAFRQAAVRPALGDSLAVVRAAWQTVIPPIAFWEAALQQDYHEHPALLKWQERDEVERLLMALRQTAVDDQVVVTSEEVETFYRDNPQLFKEPAELWLQEVLLQDLDQAAQLRQRLDQGATLDELISLSQRPGAVEAEGKLHLHSYEKAKYGGLIEQALQAALGQLVGPVKVTGGYSIFRLLEKSGGNLMPFDTVQQRAEATLRYQREQPIFAVLVGAVRELYADQVRIFEDVLRQVRLPEEVSLSPETAAPDFPRPPR